MSNVAELTLEVLKQIRAELRDGLGAVRDEVRKTTQRLDDTNQRLDDTNRRLDGTNQRLEELREMQDVLANEHRRTNQRLDFFAQELVRMRTADAERIARLESAVAELQRKVG